MIRGARDNGTVVALLRGILGILGEKQENPVSCTYANALSLPLFLAEKWGGSSFGHSGDNFITGW
jgi:hypothetical protein